MNNLNDICYIDGKAFLLSDIEAMGFDNFGLNAHITPYVSVFKYYPNTKVYVKSEKKYHNYSFETSLDKGTQRKTTENELPSLTQCTA